MDATIKTAWLEALESGKYKQGKDWLKTHDGNYCCLGVLACVVRDKFPTRLEQAKVSIVEDLNSLKVVESDDDYSTLTGIGVNLRDNIGLTNQQTIQLMNINDDSENFDDVVKLIKEKL